MHTAIKTTYDTLTTGPKRDRAYYLERHRRRKGLLQRAGGGRLARFREIAKHKRLTVNDVLRGALDRVFVSEYLCYMWHVNPLCAYCGVRLTRKTITRDHVVPSSRGGLSEPDNLVPSCAPCNRAKGNRSLLCFLAIRAEVAKRATEDTREVA